MFPLRRKRPRRAPLTAEQRSDRRVVAVLAAAIVGVALLIAYTFRDVPLLVGAVLTLAALVVRVVVDPNNGLLATCAPLPDVHTPPVATATGLIRMVEVIPPAGHYPTHDTALAESVGVWRTGRHSLAGQTADTHAIPVVHS